MSRARWFGSFAWLFTGAGGWGASIVIACGSSSDSATPGPDTGADVASEASDAPIDRAQKSLTPTYHRTATTFCGKTRPAAAPGDSGAGDAGADPCKVDGDCVAGKNGRCIYGEAASSGKCSYDECYADTECASGEICMCRDAQEIIPDLSLAPGERKPNNTLCVAAGACKIDNDCGSGGYCSPSYDPTTRKFSYQCHLPADECTNDDDCICASGGTDLCFFDPAKAHWACWLKDCR